VTADLVFPYLGRRKDWRRLTSGAIPPFGSLLDLPMVCDPKLSDNDTISINAGDHSVSVSMQHSDYLLAEKPEVGKDAD
jgi:prolyl-tRNA editing enzyme YbaK/EbsC (Cys-tRNA(Pro) deacylase)